MKIEMTDNDREVTGKEVIQSQIMKIIIGQQAQIKG